MKYNKKCTICNNAFSAVAPIQKLCSDECRKIHIRNEYEKKQKNLRDIRIEECADKYFNSHKIFDKTELMWLYRRLVGLPKLPSRFRDKKYLKTEECIFELQDIVYFFGNRRIRLFKLGHIHV